MSNLSTFVARLSDSMILVATMDNGTEVEEYKGHAKKILKTLSGTSPSRCTIEAGPYYFHYIIEQGVVYLTLAEKGYPRRLAFQFMEELQRDFWKAHGHEVQQFSRPYAAVQFDPKMNKLRREYVDPRSPQNVKKMNSDLHEIQHILHQNITDVLRRGETLETVHDKTSDLVQRSKKFHGMAKYYNFQLFLRKYVPLVLLALFVILVLWWRFR